jgi:hypothetical protein
MNVAVTSSLSNKTSTPASSSVFYLTVAEAHGNISVNIFFLRVFPCASVAEYPFFIQAEPATATVRLPA